MLSPEGSIVLSERFDTFNDTEVFNLMRDLPKLVSGDLVVFCESFLPFGANSVTAFKVGAQHMAIELACYIDKIPVHKVNPRHWSSALHGNIGKDLQPKVRNLRKAQKLYPAWAPLFEKAPHSGIVDALLISHYASHHFQNVSVPA